VHEVQSQVVSDARQVVVIVEVVEVVEFVWLTTRDS